MEESINIIDKIKSNWESGYSALLGVLFIIFSYFLLGEYLLQDKFVRYSIYNIYVLLGLIIIFLIIWYISTNRFPIVFSSKPKIAILINIDDEKYKATIKDLIINSIGGFKETYSDVKFIILPINYKNNSKEIKQFFDTRGFLIDCLFWIELKSGSFLNGEITQEKMCIESIKCMTRNDVSKNKMLYSSYLNISSDIKLANFHKNWDYINSSTYIDKKKYKYNLSELMLQFISVYLAYNDEYEKSVDILQNLSSNENELNNVNGKNIFKKPRFNTIIIELLLSLIFKNFFDKKDYKECIILSLKLLPLLKGNNPFYSETYSVLAYCYYKLQNIEKAKYYTQELKTKQPSNPIIVINEALFAIIENQPEIVAKKYRNLRLRFSTLKGLTIQDSIDFLELEKKKFIEIEIKFLFDFGIAFLLYSYTDKELGYKLLNSFIKDYSETDFYNKNLLNFAKEQSSKYKKKKVA